VIQKTLLIENLTECFNKKSQVVGNMIRVVVFILFQIQKIIPIFVNIVIEFITKKWRVFGFEKHKNFPI